MASRPALSASVRQKIARKQAQARLRAQHFNLPDISSTGVTHNFLSRALKLRGTTKLELLAATTDRLRMLGVFKTGGAAMFYCQGSELAVIQWSKMLEHMQLREYQVCSPVSPIALDEKGVVSEEFANPQQGLVKCNTTGQFETRMEGIGLSSWWRQRMEAVGHDLHNTKHERMQKKLRSALVSLTNTQSRSPTSATQATTPNSKSATKESTPTSTSSTTATEAGSFSVRYCS